jgi:serine/threonine protein phosphatase PrpC
VDSLRTERAHRLPRASSRDPAFPQPDPDKEEKGKGKERRIKEKEKEGEMVESALVGSDAATRNEVIKTAFLKTNDDLRARSFETSFSGSTAATVLLAGDKLVCCNVGDSRALLASYKNPRLLPNFQLPADVASQLHENDKIWLALPVSRDHKPDDVDEHKRIIAAHGRVEPFKEPNGDPVGPYRVWLENDNIPGLAMSRSLGDKVAQQVGVICDPEIFEMKLTPDDKFLIIASDGIWEFIPNDKAVELVVPFWIDNDPEGACDKLISESVQRWKSEDEVIDDITVIVIFLSIP